MIPFLEFTQANPSDGKTALNVSHIVNLEEHEVDGCDIYLVDRSAPVFVTESYEDVLSKINIAIRGASARG